MTRFKITGEQVSLSAEIGAFLKDTGFFQDDSAPEIIVGVFMTYDYEAQAEAQRAAHRAGAGFTPVLLGPLEVIIGPAVPARGRACVQCFHLWVTSRWSRAERDAQAAIGHGSITYPASLRALVPPIVADAIAQMHTPPVPARFAWSADCSSGWLSRHLVLPHPECRLCVTPAHDRPQAALATFTRRPKQATDSYRLNETPPLDVLKRTVDVRTGLIKSLSRYDLSYVLNMSFAAFPVDSDMSVAEIGVGRTGSELESDSVAILEALERYAGFRPREKRCAVRARFRDLNGNAIDPRRFILHDEEQKAEPGYRLAAYNDDAECNWTWAYSFRRDAPVLIPEQLAYYRLPYITGKPVDRFVFESSNGCAIGSCREEAIFHGLLEIIERDAFLTSWYGRIPPTELDLKDARDPNIRALIARTEAFGVKVHVFAMDVGLPVAQIWALVADDRPDAVRSYSAAAAHPVPEKAILSALIEVTTSLIVSAPDRTNAMRERAATMLADSALVQEQNDHIHLHAHPDSYQRLSFLFDGPKASIREFYSDRRLLAPTDDLTADMMRLSDEVLSIADDIIVVDQDFSLLRDLGLHCAKVLAPGLHPVTFGHQYRRISHHRLRKAWARDPSTANRGPTGINPFPHNFP